MAGSELSDYLWPDIGQGRQPQGGAQIDWTNPITRGLEVTAEAWGGLNLGAAPAKLKKVTSKGVVSAYDSPGDQYTVPLATPVVLGDNFTMFALASAVSVVTLAPPIFALRGGGSTSAALLFKIFGTSFFGCDIRSGAIDTPSNIPFPTTGNQVACFARYSNGATLDLGCDGSVYTVAKSIGSASYSQIDVLSKTQAGDLPNSGSTLLIGLVWTRSLSNAELRSIQENPWQVFAQGVELPFIPAAISGGATTVIPIGQQANGAIGTPFAIGAAIATPTGVQAAGSAGAPAATGGASIPATALATGVSVTSAVGSPIAKGAAKALPTGVNASSLVGAPSATGAAKSAPIGVQATGFTGTPIAIGGVSIPAIAAPSGVAASSYVGAPTATGQAKAYPSGVQSVGFVGAPVAIAGGAAVAMPSGVQSVGAVGSMIAKGESWVVPTGVQAVGATGVPAAIGQTATPANAYPQGLLLHGYVGVPIAFETSSATPSIYAAISPAQNYIATVQAQSYTATVSA